MRFSPSGDGRQRGEFKITDNGIGMDGQVLIAEDHPLNREVIVRLLKKLNIEATCLENGEKALETLRASEPGYYRMVLMDLRMPVMDGMELISRIRANCLFDKVAIIANTQYGAPEQEERLLLGADDFPASPSPRRL